MPPRPRCARLESCIHRCDLEIEDLVSAPLAAGLSSLVPEERELGATIIDMGGGTTSMAVYADKQMMHTSQLAIGGLHVTKDLAIGLSTTLIHAERLKTLFGNVESSPDDDREMLPVPLVGEEDHQLAKVPRSMVVNIIRPRIEETFEYIKDRLDSSGHGRAAGNRVVLTGGACQLPGRPRNGGEDAQPSGATRASGGAARFAGTCVRSRIFHCGRLVVLGGRRWEALPGHQSGRTEPNRSVPPICQFFERTCLNSSRIESVS